MRVAVVAAVTAAVGHVLLHEAVSLQVKSTVVSLRAQSRLLWMHLLRRLWRRWYCSYCWRCRYSREIGVLILTASSFCSKGVTVAVQQIRSSWWCCVEVLKILRDFFKHPCEVTAIPATRCWLLRRLRITVTSHDFQSEMKDWSERISWNEDAVERERREWEREIGAKLRVELSCVGLSFFEKLECCRTEIN